MTILYGVSPIGLGHASRAVAIGVKLREVGLNPEFVTGGNAASFLTSYGFRVHDLVTEPVPSESHGVMINPTLWYLRYWLGYRSTSMRMSKLMDELRPALVVGDEEFSCLSIAVRRGIQNVMISDELQLGFARSAISRYAEGKVSFWYQNLQRNVSHLLVPDFGDDRGNVRHVGPVVRSPTRSRKELFSEFGFPENSMLILFSASGSGIGRFFAEATVRAFTKLRPADTLLAVSGMVEVHSSDPDVRHLGLVRDNQDLVAAADLVISTAGKSTIDEAISYGTPLITLPIKNHAEQERNAAALGFSYADVRRLGALIAERLGHRSEPRDYRGAGLVADYLSKLVKTTAD